MNITDNSSDEKLPVHEKMNFLNNQVINLPHKKLFILRRNRN